MTTRHAFDVTIDEPGLHVVDVCANGESVVRVRLERNADGSLYLNVFEMANDDTEFDNTYPEFFAEVIA